MAYSERLYVPVRWWALAGVGVLSLLLAYAVALGGASAALGAALLAVGMVVWLSGQPTVTVDATGLSAGLAHLPAWAVGQVDALDADATRLASTRDADPHGYFMLKGYVRTAVRVWVDDPADPVPYWLVSTRNPASLAAALAAARDEAR